MKKSQNNIKYIFPTGSKLDIFIYFININIIMVRINLIHPKKLLDQHLCAEYNEIQMLFGYTQNHPYIDGSEPEQYCLGKGHIKFFKNKIQYLVERLKYIKNEMINRGYQPQEMVADIIKSYNIPKLNFGMYKPTFEAIKIIKQRLMEKYLMKPDWYTYYGNKIGISEYELVIQ